MADFSNPVLTPRLFGFHPIILYPAKNHPIFQTEASVLFQFSLRLIIIFGIIVQLEEAEEQDPQTQSSVLVRPRSAIEDHFPISIRRRVIIIAHPFRLPVLGKSIFNTLDDWLRYDMSATSCTWGNIQYSFTLDRGGENEQQELGSILWGFSNIHLSSSTCRICIDFYSVCPPVSSAALKPPPCSPTNSSTLNASRKVVGSGLKVKLTRRTGDSLPIIICLITSAANTVVPSALQLYYVFPSDAVPFDFNH